jgi:hypothetical protein
MDFSVIFQLRTKKFWWMDVIFYFVISMLVAAVLCYVIFLTKNSFQAVDIAKETEALKTVGTKMQLDQEKSVISYQKKIVDFTELLKNHEFASNVFAFVQAQTMPNVWFKQFNLDEKNNGVQLSGEADSLDAFSRQVLTFEGNEYVKDIGTLNSSLGESSRTIFNINLVLDQSIFGYLSNSPSLIETTTPSNQSPIQSGQATPISSAAPVSGSAVTQLPVVQPVAPTQSSENLITSFHLLLTPEVAGVVNETNYTVTLNVPYGTDVKNLTPSIVISPGATVLPDSGVSQDFTSPVSYRVTAQDGSVQKYVVTVVVASPPVVVKKSNQSGYIILAIILLIIVVIAAAGIFLFLRKKNKKTQ